MSVTGAEKTSYFPLNIFIFPAKYFALVKITSRFISRKLDFKYFKLNNFKNSTSK